MSSENREDNVVIYTLRKYTLPFNNRQDITCNNIVSKKSLLLRLKADHGAKFEPNFTINSFKVKTCLDAIS